MQIKTVVWAYRPRNSPQPQSPVLICHVCGCQVEDQWSSYFKHFIHSHPDRVDTERSVSRVEVAENLYKERTAGQPFGQSNRHKTQKTTHGQGSKAHAHQSDTSSEAARPGYSSNDGPQQKQDARTIATKKENNDTELIKPLETRPVTHEQLVAEVKDIYAGLVKVESKCIEACDFLGTEEGAINLNDEQCQALLDIHRTLLKEHHDFFLASQHPSAQKPLRDLAERYVMPARMWRYGIQSFLEVLRHRLPASLEHMLAFIYLAYSMMALLYEIVPEFKDTWVECLGYLSRYRMAIEDDSMADRETWTAVSRHWYSKCNKAPGAGRLHHHLAILARPKTLELSEEQ